MSLLYDLKPHDVISPAYCALQKELHARPKGYGGKGDKWAPAVAALITRFGATSILDFGSGEGSLARALRLLPIGFVRIDEYDPAVPGYDRWPGFADLVICTDVLEHIEPEKLDTVLQLLQTLARKAIFLVIATRPSNKTMADGRNAHLIVESAAWWTAKLEALGFTVEPGPPSPLRKPSREIVVVCPVPT